MRERDELLDQMLPDLNVFLADVAVENAIVYQNIWQSY